MSLLSAGSAMLRFELCVGCKHFGLHGIQTFGFAWNANSKVCVECKHLGQHTMQTSRPARDDDDDDENGDDNDDGDDNLKSS